MYACMYVGVVHVCYVCMIWALCVSVSHERRLYYVTRVCMELMRVCGCVRYVVYVCM